MNDYNSASLPLPFHFFSFSSFFVAFFYPLFFTKLRTSINKELFTQKKNSMDVKHEYSLICTFHQQITHSLPLIILICSHKKHLFLIKLFSSLPLFLACVGLTLIFLPWFWHRQQKIKVYLRWESTNNFHLHFHNVIISFAMVMSWILLYYCGIYLALNRQNVSVGSESSLWEMFVFLCDFFWEKIREKSLVKICEFFVLFWFFFKFWQIFYFMKNF